MKAGRKRYILSFLLIFILLGLVIWWNICSGSISLTGEQIRQILLGDQENGTAYNIIWEIRLPRILAALLLGGALSVSGFLLQTFIGNPITMIAFLGKGITLSSWGMVAAAFLGSLLAMGFVLLVSVRVHDMSMLVVCGIMIGYICSAITDFCVTFADDSNIVNLHNWSLGSFSGMTWQSVRLMAVLVLLGVCVSFLLAKPISAYQMGEAYARNMGVRIGLLRVLLILLSSILSACVTAFAGPISFVGIAVPHLVKTLTKTAKPLLLIPGCFLGGAVITLFCDGIARTVFAPTEISISSVTAVLLVPVVLVMMLKKRRGSL